MRRLRKWLLWTAAIAIAAPLAASDVSQAQSIVEGNRSVAPQATGPSAPIQGRLPLVDSVEVDRYASSASAAPSGASGAIFGSMDGSGGAIGGSPGSQSAPAPQAFGTHNFPYTTVRSAVWVLGALNNNDATPVTSYPFRPAGKLWMRFGNNWFVCTASLLRKGILITAAHCVHNYGQRGNGFANAVIFQPARVGNTLPYQQWGARTWIIPGTYYAGTDTCTTVGVVCNNDLAIVVLWPNNNVYPGQLTGTYGWGWNGYSFVTSAWHGNRFLGQITQLGYPQAINSGVHQIRTDTSSAFYTATGTNGKQLRQQTIGSAQTGGSSGGPYIVNFGRPASYGAGSHPGSATSGPVVVGANSWGFNNPVNANRGGASWFGQNAEFPGANYGGWGAGNIGALLQYACTSYAAHC